MLPCYVKLIVLDYVSNLCVLLLAKLGLCWLCNAHYMCFLYFVMTIAQTICASFVMTIAQLYVLILISLSIMNYLLPICLDVSILCQFYANLYHICKCAKTILFCIILHNFLHNFLPMCKNHNCK
jgi:hypothetical protein